MQAYNAIATILRNQGVSSRKMDDKMNDIKIAIDMGQTDVFGVPFSKCYYGVLAEAIPRTKWSEPAADLKQSVANWTAQANSQAVNVATIPSVKHLGAMIGEHVEHDEETTPLVESEPKPKRNMKMVWLIIAGIVIIAIVAILLGVFLGPKKASFHNSGRSSYGAARSPCCSQLL